MRYTPASSPAAPPTRRFRFFIIGRPRSTCARAFWLSLGNQPAQEDSHVSVKICSRDMRDHLLSEGCGVEDSSPGGSGGEGRNRTYPPTQSVGGTGFETATTPRAASRSGQTAAGTGETANRQS